MWCLKPAPSAVYGCTCPSTPKPPKCRPFICISLPRELIQTVREFTKQTVAPQLSLLFLFLYGCLSQPETCHLKWSLVSFMECYIEALSMKGEDSSQICVLRPKFSTSQKRIVQRLFSPPSTSTLNFQVPGPERSSVCTTNPSTSESREERLAEVAFTWYAYKGAGSTPDERRAGAAVPQDAWGKRAAVFTHPTDPCQLGLMGGVSSQWLEVLSSVSPRTETWPSVLDCMLWPCMRMARGGGGKASREGRAVNPSSQASSSCEDTKEDWMQACLGVRTFCFASWLVVEGKPDQGEL